MLSIILKKNKSRNHFSVETEMSARAEVSVEFEHKQEVMLLGSSDFPKGDNDLCVKQGHVLKFLM